MLGSSSSHFDPNADINDTEIPHCSGLPRPSALSLGGSRGRGSAASLRFRTIQVCPKDLPAHLRQVERAVSQPTAAQGGWRHSGRAAAEVGAVLIVGGNIDGFTRTMTTAIALEASKGDLSPSSSWSTPLPGACGGPANDLRGDPCARLSPICRSCSKT